MARQYGHQISGEIWCLEGARGFGLATAKLEAGAGDGYTHVFVLLDDIELPPATFSLAVLLPHDATPLHMHMYMYMTCACACDMCMWG